MLHSHYMSESIGTYQYWFFNVVLIITLSAIVNVHAAEENTTTQIIERKSMNFHQCLNMINDKAVKFGVTPVRIFATKKFRLVQFDPDDGSGLSYQLSCTESTMQLNRLW
jgi:hypothetical protein